MTSVVLGRVRGELVHGEHEACVRRLLGRYGDLSWVESAGSQLVQQRNHVVRGFLGTDADWLFFVDSDMTFEPDVLDRLLGVADPVDRPVVGGLTVKFDPRSRVVLPTMYDWDGSRFVQVLEWEPGEPRLCGATGAACVVVHRSVFERMEPLFSVERPWFDLGASGEFGGLGEDMTFFARCRDMGVPVWVHTGVLFGHLKTVELTVRDFVMTLEG